MQFKEFQQRLPKIAKMELPGEAYHLAMAPLKRVLELKRKATQSQTAQLAAVLALFYPDIKGVTHFVLMLRQDYKGTHANQISFPGGKMEREDNSILATALRETEEEIGVPASQVKICRALTPTYIPPSNFLVTPFVGSVDKTPDFVPDATEVHSLFSVPLAQLLAPSTRVTKTLSTSYAKQIDVPAFLLNNQVVWGATAMILNEFYTLFKRL